MHDFPPNVFNNVDALWSFGPGAVMLLILLLLYASFSVSRYHGRQACFTWSAGTAFAIAVCLGTWGAAREPRGPGLWSLAFSLLLVAVSLVALTRTIRRTRQAGGAATTVMAMITGFVLLVFFVSCTPRLRGGRELVGRTQCKHNLRFLSLAMCTYEDVHSSFPAAVSGRPVSSWRIRLLPYLDRSSFAERYHWDKEWDAEDNRPFQYETMIEYDCPSRPQKTDSRGRFLTAYVCPTGAGTMFAGENGIAMGSITDGSANTLMLLEACGTRIVWTEPRDIDVGSTPAGINQPGAEADRSDGVLSSYHYRGALAALADGSVMFLNENTDPEILKALLTAAGGESVSSEW